MSDQEELETETIASIEVPEDESPARLDKYLANALPELSRSRIKALITGGQVLQGGETITDPSIKVKPGQTFDVEIPEPESAIPVPQKMDLDIVFEDDHLIVLNKPAGLVVHPAPGTPDGTLVNALLAHCGDSLSGIGGVRRPGIVHRLDKDTSGLMVAAKNDQAHVHLSRQFEDHSLERAYMALVWGTPKHREGTIEGNIGRSPRNRKKMALVEHGGKHAVTHFETIRAVGSVATLVECRLETGRTHQIRVHMSHVGHTVVGDALYGKTPTRVNRRVREIGTNLLDSLERHALHAFLIGFEHPATRQKLSFETELPMIFDELEDVLKRV